MNRNTVAVLAVVGLLLTAGCLDMTMTVTVSADGDIDSMDVEMEMDEMLYSEFEQDAEEEGYDSVEAMFEADMMEDAEEGEIGDVSSSVEQLEDGTYLLTLSMIDVDPDAMDDIEITTEDGMVYFEDSDAVDEGDALNGDGGMGGDDMFDDDGMGDDGTGDDDMSDDDGMGDDGMDDGFGEFDEQVEDQISMEYVVSMPGEIQDANADSVSDDGTTATWDLMTTEETTLYAESDTSDSSGSSDDNDDSDDDSMPGFGVVAGLIALLLLAVGRRYRTRPV